MAGDAGQEEDSRGRLGELHGGIGSQPAGSPHPSCSGND